MDQAKESTDIELTDLGTCLGRIARQVLLRGEMLRGISKLWIEYDSIEGAEIASQLGAELGQIGRQLKLLREQLCQNCQLIKVEEGIRFGKSDKAEKE
jgi:hypothetical protein